MYSAFTPASTSFIIEAKHKEGAYYRNRFYATDGRLTAAANNSGWDYGYFSSDSANSSLATVYWNGLREPSSNAGTDYLTRWDVTDGSNYSWSNYNYNSGSLIYTQSQTVNTIRYLTFKLMSRPVHLHQ